MRAELEIRSFRSWVRLGCSTEERAFPQEVEVSLKLAFHAVPQGATSDLLSETLCYAEICRDMDAICRSGEFSLVERLADALIQAVRRRVDGQASLDLSVHKLRPPIEGLRGGVIFRLHEESTS